MITAEDLAKECSVAYAQRYSGKIYGKSHRDMPIIGSTMTGKQFHDFFGHEIYKPLNETANHDGIQFVEGLNIDSDFSDSLDSSINGFYFAHANEISNFIYCSVSIGLMTKISKVIVSDDEIVYIEKNKFKAHSFTLDPFKDLWTSGLLQIEIIKNRNQMYRHYLYKKIHKEHHEMFKKYCEIIPERIACLETLEATRKITDFINLFKRE